LFLEFSEDAGEAPLVKQSSPPVGVIGAVQSSVPDGCNGALAVVASVLDSYLVAPLLDSISAIYPVWVLFVVEQEYLMAAAHLPEHIPVAQTHRLFL
jgi:hypothetical protein